MATTDANGMVFYGPTDPVEPLQGLFNGQSSAISSKIGAETQIVRIANVAGRAAAVTARSGRPITSADPLIVWRADASAGLQLEYTTNGTAWATMSAPGAVYQTQTTAVALVGVSTMSTVLTLNLPASAPPGTYNVDTCMISRSDAAAPTYVRVAWGGTALAGSTDPTDNPANQDVCRTITHTVQHSGGAATVTVGLQINGGSAAWNRSRPATSVRVTRVGPLM